MLFVARDNNVLSLYEAVLSSSKSLTNNCLQDVTIKEGREYFTKEIASVYRNLDCYRESILMELRYYEKFKMPLVGKDYIEATSWYLQEYKDELSVTNSRLQIYQNQQNISYF